MLKVQPFLKFWPKTGEGENTYALYIMIGKYRY